MHHLKKTWGKAPSPFCPSERPIASDDSLGKGTGEEIISSPLPWARSLLYLKPVRLNPPVKRNVGYSVGPVTRKVVFLPAIGGGCLLSFQLALLLSALTFQVRRHSLTLQFRAELHFEHETVADWSQFCCKPMLNFILICSLQIFYGGWQGWQYCGNIE